MNTRGKPHHTLLHALIRWRGSDDRRRFRGLATVRRGEAAKFLKPHCSVRDPGGLLTILRLNLGNRMPKYIIHIGPRRSGSRYIQSHLFHSRDYLKEHGVLYPDIWWKKPDKIMHDSLEYDLRAGKDLKADFDKLNASGAEIIILSFEGFEGLQIPELERLKEYVAGHQIEIVYYARRWCERIPSIWRWHVSVGNYETFPEFCIRLLSSPDSTSEINYSIVWKTFVTVFGRDSLRIVSYNNLVDRGVDLFEHFSQDVIGVSTVPQVAIGLIRRNGWPDMIDAEIIRTLNYLYYEETSRIDPSMRIKLNRLKRQYDLRALREKLRTETEERPKFMRIQLQDEAESLRPAWQEMRTYADRLVSPQYGEKIFERREAVVEFARQNYLLSENVLDKVTKLYQFLKTEEPGTRVLRAPQ